MMTVDEMLSEVAKIVDTAPKNSAEAERTAAPKKQEAVNKKTIPDAVTTKKPADTVPSAAEVSAAPSGVPVRLRPALGLGIAKEIAYCVEKAADIIGVKVVTAIADEGETSYCSRRWMIRTSRA